MQMAEAGRSVSRMPDRGKIMSWLEGLAEPDWRMYHSDSEVQTIAKETLVLLKEQEAKPPIHIYEEYSEHDWERTENGDIDTFALTLDYHNGPMCKRCDYSFCIHCDPSGWNRKSCVIDEYKCPKCGGYITKHTKFCCGCGQEVKWDG